MRPYDFDYDENTGEVLFTKSGVFRYFIGESEDPYTGRPQHKFRLQCLKRDHLYNKRNAHYNQKQNEVSFFVDSKSSLKPGDSILILGS